MFINITESETGNNKGSSSALVNYLEKENHLQTTKGADVGPEYWFNGTSEEISRQEVRLKIDCNIAKLSRSDSKFFLINISPSQKELAHLSAKYGEHNVKEKLKRYAVKMMDEYARNFKRPGIDSHKDLLWFAKAEHYRYYKFDDKEVKEGNFQTGERKPGNQLHVQIIVSRKDLSNTVKLSPQNTSKGKNAAHSSKLGQFDRTAFKESGERLFDQQYHFDRGLKETMAFANTMKNGTAEQKAQMQILSSVPQDRGAQSLIKDLGRDVSHGLFESLADMISTTGQVGPDLFSMLIEPTYTSPNISTDDDAAKSKKKKKKGQSRDHGYTR